MDRYRTRIADTPGPGWDESLLLGSTGSLALYQTSHWAARQEELQSFKPAYITVEDQDQAVLRLTVFASDPFKLRGARNIAHGLYHALRSGKRGSLLWHGQPVAFTGAEESAYRALAQAVDGFAAERSLRVSAGEWPLDMAAALPERWKRKKWATLKVELTPEPEEIFAGFKSSARKAIKKAQQDGITVRRVADLVELEQYYHFAAECARRYHKSLIGFRDFSSMWQYLRPNGIYETFIAEHDGEMIAGLSVWGYGDCIGEVGSFQSGRSFREKLYGPDLIKWEMLRWACGRNLKIFDLAGINPEPRDEKEKNIRRFKEKWGGGIFYYLMITV
ncbi:MAG: hypothetical protein A2Z86_06205 [Candidatus Glassbacteria bacterium GWA2_58_10]|uniref:BioF2-like acetyltransferase domain-containing protein n=1 Tax=Candidatus Glassbacteria bacterium GWA2_58_10 TaxID=1817865 RepID=A0A1F5YGQ8_9BACT|nr:MAG: hypothetical protein A2Z86_06205 [Candidatus Glassbacteria bacterium GWA2_58_10]